MADFAEFGSELASALSSGGISVMTGAQEAFIPIIKAGKDACLCAETGSGKTLSYLLPMFEQADKGLKAAQAVVLAPNYELCSQIAGVCHEINSGLSEDKRLLTALLVGGAGIGRQLEVLKKKPQLIIGTPGRVLELIGMKKLSVHNVKTIVLDEGDKLVRTSMKDTSEIIKRTQKDRQIVAVSAFFNAASLEALKSLMDNPINLDIKSLSIPDTISHKYIVCGKRDKLETMRKIVNLPELTKALVFVNAAYENEKAFELLVRRGFPSVRLSSDMDGADRKRAHDLIRNGGAKAIIATDALSRGMDFPGLSHVISLDTPDKPGDYIHRAGRTGRNAAAGTSLSILTSGEAEKLKTLEGKLGIKINEAVIKDGKLV